MVVEAFWLDKDFIRVQLNNEDYPLIYPITTPKAKQYCGFRLILKDLKIVKDIIQILMPLRYNGDSTLTKQSLSFYAIVTYAKCFTEAKGRGTKLDKANALKYATQREIQEHDTIMDERHNYVAHGGLKGHEQNILVASVSKDNSVDKIIDVYDNIMGLVDIDSQLDHMNTLVDTVIKYVGEKCDSLYGELRDELQNMNMDEIRQKAIDPQNFDLIKIKVN